MHKINMIEGGLPLLPRFKREGYGREAAVYQGHVYVSDSHHNALMDVFMDINGLPVYPTREQIDAIYERVGFGDLKDQIMHAWFSREYWYVAWNYTYGE
jgi:hypothetical protein